MCWRLRSLRAILMSRTQVHLKARNHRCAMCGNGFARRDTLRRSVLLMWAVVDMSRPLANFPIRHTEDGCPKRFELGIREGSAATPARWALTNFPKANRAYSLAIPHSSPVAPSPTTMPSTFPNYERPEFVGTAATTPSVYTS